MNYAASSAILGKGRFARSFGRARRDVAMMNKDDIEEAIIKLNGLKPVAKSLGIAFSTFRNHAKTAFGLDW
jgi:hypothetical protein